MRDASANGAGNGSVGKISFYAPGYFPSSKPSVPPIYATTLRRSKEALEVDGKLRDASNSQELWGFIASALPRFDTGNLVVAFTTAAKVDEGGSEIHQEIFLELVERLLSSVESLEPRGLSMTAYSAAKLLFGDHRLWSQLSAASCRCCHRFGATDVAKATWAFAKLRFVDEMPEFWQCMVEPAIAALRTGARFVDVSMIAWAFASTQRATAALMEEVARETLQALPELPPRSIAGIAWAFAKAGAQHQQLFTQLRERAKLVLREFSAHDAAAFCWAFSALGCADSSLFTELALHLDSDGSHRATALRRLSPPLAAEFSWALASASVEAPSVFATLQELCVSNMEILETEDVCGFAWAFATQNGTAVTFDAIARYAERYAGRLRPAEVNLLCWALNGRAQIGPRLRAAQR
ncbi:unnamed protein product [Cladocopium goreaui]|uniref:Tbc2 translation factor, chloroplastic n=1 Tax=Cladocopium goreaui TaxID=2562237 RepID=A0A9P1FR38_9DINO|nr:unnamed protein product [Cladocopium goreaui]